MATTNLQVVADVIYATLMAETIPSVLILAVRDSLYPTPCMLHLSLLASR